MITQNVKAALAYYARLEAERARKQWRVERTRHLVAAATYDRLMGAPSDRPVSAPDEVE